MLTHGKNSTKTERCRVKNKDTPSPNQFYFLEMTSVYFFCNLPEIVWTHGHTHTYTYISI